MDASPLLADSCSGHWAGPLKKPDQKMQDRKMQDKNPGKVTMWIMQDWNLQDLENDKDHIRMHGPVRN